MGIVIARVSVSELVSIVIPGDGVVGILSLNQITGYLMVSPSVPLDEFTEKRDISYSIEENSIYLLVTAYDSLLLVNGMGELYASR